MTAAEISQQETRDEEATSYLGQSLAEVRESWEPETTENNLRHIVDARRKHSKEIDWLNQIIEALHKEWDFLVVDKVQKNGSNHPEFMDILETGSNTAFKVWLPGRPTASTCVQSTLSAIGL